VGGVLVAGRELSPREVLALDANVVVFERDGLAGDILDHLDVAGARAHEPTHLTTAELVDRVDAERPAVEQALATLRFDDQRVLKGQHLGSDQGDVRTMMAAGGWSDYAAIEPYLAESTEGRIGEAIRG
jgi:hypothetical protein